VNSEQVGLESLTSLPVSHFLCSSVCVWQKSSKLSRVSSGEDDLEKDGKEGEQKSSSDGGDTDIQNATDNKVADRAICID